MGNVLSADSSADKHYKHSGFSATISDSYSSPDIAPAGITWDGANVISADTNVDKHFLHSGFSASISDSYASPTASPTGITWDETNVISAGRNDPVDDKHYLHSGFSASISDSYISPGNFPAGITWDGTNVIASDTTAEKHYLHSGFSASISDSYASPSTLSYGMTWDRTNVISSDYNVHKHYLHSGFSASISDSYASPSTNSRGITWDDRFDFVAYDEIWYFRTTAGSACGPGDRESISETQGSSDSTKALDGTGDTWNVAESRTIAAGNWVVLFDVQCPSGGGAQNEIDVLVERRNSSCVVQGSAIINETVNIDKGVTKEYSTTPTNPGEITFSSGDLVTVILTDGRGNQTKTLQYNGSGSGYDSRLGHPEGTGGAPAIASLRLLRGVGR